MSSELSDDFHASRESRLKREESFHDQWASNEASAIDPVHVNTAVTSPELRYIHEHLGSVKGKSVLDLGCGLGEASVFFALNGASVTSLDVSQEMLNFTNALASKYDVTVETHLAAAEDLGLPTEKKFDIIYTGNLLHHVEIETTLDKTLAHLKSDGTFASWDPLAYNPLINVYRLIATQVRTIDEHPLTQSDIAGISSRFKAMEMKFFWLTTLSVFTLMLLQFNKPNKVRYWKAVVEDSDKWAWIYQPLESIDQTLIKLFPPLRWLCWNVVILAKNPK